MALSSFLLASLLSASASAAVLVSPPGPLTSDWTISGSATISTVDFTIALTQPGKDEIKRIAKEVSNPKSEKYTQYLTQAEINEITKPTQADVETVTSWLDSNFCSFEKNHRTLAVSCPLAKAEQMLGTKFQSLINVHTKQSTVRSVSAYSVPESVDAAISAIFGIHGLPLPPNAALRTQALVPGKPVDVTPDVIASTYGVSGVDVKGDKVSQAVAEFQGQYFSQAHLSEFFEHYVDKYANGADIVSRIIGENNNRTVGVEAELDIQYIMGVAPGVSTDFYSQKNMDFCQDLAKWTDLLLSGDDVPVVHSVSYGWQGPLSQIQCAEKEAKEVDDAFVKLAAKGISILFASGDSGSGYDDDSLKAKLYPSWPASSPWVTSVGATRFQDQEKSEPEMATDQFGSGGGFSWMFDRSDASYQEEAVKTYFNTDEKIPPAKVYNADGRGTPDVAALGEGFQVLTGFGKKPRPQSVGGTSASTPLFSGLVSLLNDARAQKEMKPLGFLNPWLYQNADCFTDITVGTNAIDRSGLKVEYGWKCTTGWDAATGLGTPIFSKLLEAALKN